MEEGRKGRKSARRGGGGGGGVGGTRACLLFLPLSSLRVRFIFPPRSSLSPISQEERRRELAPPLRDLELEGNAVNESATKRPTLCKIIYVGLKKKK